MEEVKELEDPRAFVSRVYPHRSAMLGVARRYLRAEDAEDVVQVALLRAYTRRETFATPPGVDPEVALRSWLLRVTYRVFATVSRGDVACGLRIRTLGAHEISLDPASGSDSRTFEDAGLAELSEEQPEHEYELAPRYAPEVEEALLSLPREFRRVLLLVDSGHSYQQVADETGMPIGTVMSRLYRARAALKLSLGTYALREYGLSSRDRTRKHAPRREPAQVVQSDPDRVCGVVVVRRRRAL